jgi:putative zinc finger protein
MTSPYACARCRERLPWYAARTLPMSERAEVEEHLAGCAACRREVALWRAVGSALSEPGETAPEPVVAQEDVEDVTWRGVQSRIAADGHASESGLRERFLMDDETTPVASAPGTPSHRGARLAARQPLMALIAAALLIALSATLFGVYGGWLRQGGSSTATGETSCAPGKVKAHIPANTHLNGISMVSATDGWAVGQVWNSSVSGAAPRTLIMRYQHCAWSETGKSIPSASLFSVVMTSASDGWALGTTAISGGGSYWQPDQMILMRYTGGSWRRVALNGEQGPEPFDAGGFTMYSPNDGWLLLIYGRRPTQYPVLYHYQGSAWTPVALPGALTSGSGSITDFSASGPDDLWVVGSVASGAPAAGHYSSGQWRITQTPAAGHGAPTLDAIHVSSPQDVWAFGRYSHTFSSSGAGGYTDSPYVVHDSGAGWKQVPIAALGSRGSPPPDFTIFSTTVPSPDGSFLALGSAATFSEAPGLVPEHTVVLHCSTSGCQLEAFPIAEVWFVSAVSLYAPTQGFAIGDVQSSASTLTSILLTYNAGAWTRVPA